MMRGLAGLRWRGLCGLPSTLFITLPICESAIDPANELATEPVGDPARGGTGL